VAIKDLIAYLNEEDITYFDWNALSGDAVNTSLSAGELNANIMEYVRSNQGDSVVLMHDIDACENTLEALPDLIETLQNEGYTLRAIDADTTPVQHVSYQGE
jgi:peptidoglycan/xylan/chitin deacetylase (PgdA/CDA1 family)